MFIKKFIAIILSMVILSNLTVGFAFAQEPATSVVNETEKKTNVEIKNDIQKPEKLSKENLLQKLSEKEKKINSLKQKIEKNNKPILDEIKKIEKMSDKEYKTNLFLKRCKIFGGVALALCGIGFFNKEILDLLNCLRGFIGGLLIPDVILYLISGNPESARVYQKGYNDGYKFGNKLHVDSSFLDSLKKFKSIFYKLINPSNIKDLNKKDVTTISSAFNSFLDSCPKNI